MIDTLKIRSLRNAELDSLGTDLGRIYSRYNVETLILKPMVDQFSTFWDEIRTFFGESQSSPLPQNIEKLDERRDVAILGIYAVADGYRYHFDEALRQASACITAM